MFLKNAYKGKNSLIIYVVTIILVVFGYFLGQLPLSLLMLKNGAESGMNQSDMEIAIREMDFSAFGLDQNYSMFLILLTFVSAMIFLWLCVTRLHKKDFKDIITPRTNIDWSKILFSFSLWFGLTLLIEALFFLQNPDNYSFQFDSQAFAILAIIAIFLLPIQTSFEELFFRGYLMQGISLGSSTRLAPLIITSVAFGIMHIMNPEVSEFGLRLMMTYYIGVGLFLGILTLMDDSLELALGIHAATNIYGATMVTFDSSAIQTPALFKMASVDVRLMLLAFIFAAILFFIIVSKKYGLNNWDKVFGKIEKVDEGDFEANLNEA